MWVLVVGVLCFLLPVTRNVNGQEPEKSGEELEVIDASSNVPTRLPRVKGDAYFIQAYTDTFAILSQMNSCSSFYGGPRAATKVLNSLVMLVRREPLLQEITFQMSGSLTYFKDDNAGVYYRLFTKATLNSNGSFYQRREPMRKLPPDVGGFAAGSRAARVLILLHELGHLILSKTGDWLLPDDGYDSFRSRTNTLRVLEACQKQLESLRTARR
jgi:hypothetical protein